VEPVHAAWVRHRGHRRQHRRRRPSPRRRLHHRERGDPARPPGPAARPVPPPLERPALHAVRLHRQPGRPVHDLAARGRRRPHTKARDHPQRRPDPGLRGPGAPFRDRAGLQNAPPMGAAPLPRGEWSLVLPDRIGAVVPDLQGSGRLRPEDVPGPLPQLPVLRVLPPAPGRSRALPEGGAVERAHPPRHGRRPAGPDRRHGRRGLRGHPDPLAAPHQGRAARRVQLRRARAQQPRVRAPSRAPARRRHSRVHAERRGLSTVEQRLRQPRGGLSGLDKARAVANYKIALQLDPARRTAAQALQKLGAP
jgi:hypothetical protein